jgi:hypothetical protein
MSDEEYRDLLKRAEESQRSLAPHTNKSDEFADIAKRLVELLERAKQRMIRQRGGQ